MHIAKPDYLTRVPKMRVILIQHDEVTSLPLVEIMERSGFQVAVARTGADGMGLFHSFRPDVVLVDLELPDMSGTDLIGWFEQRRCGVIATSSMTEEADRVLALELGADDYIVKPPQMRELVARVRAVHRRVVRQEDRTHSPSQDSMVIGPIRINHTLRIVTTTDNRRIPLTSAEFTLLEVLASFNGQIVSRDILSQAALRRPWRPEDRSVDQLVFGLRQKLPQDEGGVAMIHTVRCGGYRLRTPDAVPMSLHMAGAQDDGAWHRSVGVQ